MKARALAFSGAAVLLALSAAGCAGDGEGAGGGPEGKDEGRAVRTVRTLRDGQLRRAELGPSEVPGLLIEKASPGTAGSGRPSTPAAACRPLVVALGSQPQPVPEASVVNTFARGSRDRGFEGLLGTIRVSAYRGEDARTTLRQLREAAGACGGGFRMRTGEGQAQTFRAVRTLPAPRLGDEAVAYRLENAAERAPSLVTVVRTGNVLAMFFATHLSDPAAVEIPDRLVRAQVAKVEQLKRTETPPPAPSDRSAGPAPEGGEAGDTDEGEE
ncbi:hypothetical protein AB0K09_05335 [Streptomyces sp. NPDC049577]|uniref:hypothetical protein n=1 Tax=Streptomyces sp. NPDC049577 TaxID=3155153 RepID=UPI0034167AEE